MDVSARISHPRTRGVIVQHPSDFVGCDAMCHSSHWRREWQPDRFRCDDHCALAPIALTLPRALEHSNGPERTYRGLSAGRERGLPLSPSRRARALQQNHPMEFIAVVALRLSAKI